MKLLLVIIILNFSYSFVMLITKLNSKNEYIKVLNNKNKIVILYTGTPCKCCNFIREQFNLISEKDNIKNYWKFYEIDIKYILEICKNKKIYKIPVYEIYKENNKNTTIENCYPYDENNIIEKIN